jgi:hypothetical protein
MGSGVLLAALVVLWFVVLVPMVVTRGDNQAGRAELADSGRTLQRTLGGLVALAALSLLGALVYSPWLWAAQVLFDVAVVGYLLVLRKTARRERMAARRAARAAAREARRTPVVPRVAAQQETVASDGLPRPPHPSVPLAPVHPLRTGRVVAARSPAPAGWQHSAVVGLDDDDIGFADIDEYQPRRVANA